MNSLKYKKKQENSIFHSIQSPHKMRYEKISFLNQNQSKIKNQPLKLQRSYRQPKIITKNQRYDSIQNVGQQIEKSKRIKSLSLKKDNQSIIKSVQKSIRMFKRSVNKNKEQKNLYSSIEYSRKSISPYNQRSRHLVLSKRLTIIDKINLTDKQTNIRNRTKQITDLQNKSRSKTKFRVIKSQFSSKLDSMEINDSVIQQSQQSLMLKKGKQHNLKKTSSQSLESVRNLVKEEKYKQALLMIKTYFSDNNDKDNLELLELFATCKYNMQQYQELTKVAQKIFTIEPGYNSQIYVMSCLAWAKLKNYQKALQIIQNGARIFPQNAQIFYYKGKILFHMRKYELSEEAFNKSYFICPLPQTLICLSDCYKKTSQLEKQLKTIQKILSTKNRQPLFNFEIIFIRKLKLLFQLKRFEQATNEILSSEKIIQSFKSHQIKAQIEYIDALCKFKKQKYQKAFEKFQDCIVSRHFYLKSLKMLIVLQALQKNFYEASHLCSQINNQAFHIQPDQIFNLLILFIEGSLSLVRRNFKQGIEILSKVELTLEKKQFNKYREQKQFINYEEAENYESFFIVKSFLHLFMSYGLFCIGQFSFCQSAISKQIQIYDNLKYRKGLDYNYKLCEAIICFQQKSFDKALLYLQQADNICPRHLEVFFYRAVILIQIYFHTLQSEETEKFTQQEALQMINSIKTNLQEALQKVSSTANNTKATVLYYRCLFHCYLKDWKQAMALIEECISKSDDNYWRYYFTKAMIFSCVHNFEEAIAELAVAINLSQGQRAQCFLLRSKCLQIQGKGNDAFYDLQQYIVSFET